MNRGEGFLVAIVAIIQWRVQMRRLRPPHLMLRKWNQWVREALDAAARFWIAVKLKLHFEPAAVQRYSYEARSPEYRRRKRGMAQKLGYDAATPLCYSKALINSMKSKSAGNGAGFRVIARATSAKQRVRVPIPLPHLMSARHAPEVGRLNNPDLNDMKKFAVGALKGRIEKFNTVEVITIG